MEADKKLLNDILKEIKGLRRDLNALKEENKLNSEYIERIKEIEKEKGKEFDSIEELDEMIQNA